MQVDSLIEVTDESMHLQSSEPWRCSLDLGLSSSGSSGRSPLRKASAGALLSTAGDHHSAVDQQRVHGFGALVVLAQMHSFLYSMPSLGKATFTLTCPLSKQLSSLSVCLCVCVCVSLPSSLARCSLSLSLSLSLSGSHMFV